MKAFYINAPGKGHFGTLDAPIPKNDEVLLQVNRVGYCGSDLNTFRGRNPLVSYPRIPGHEIAGTVIAIGADVPASYAIGQRVTLNPYKNCGDCPACRSGRINACRNNQTMGVQREGAMTEKIAVPWQRVVVSEISDLNHLALIEPLAVGFHAVRRGNIASGETVAVFGCGAIGLGVIAGAINKGANVIAIDIDDAKLKIASAVGAQYVINSKDEPLLECVSKLTNGDGVDIAIEAVGLAETFVACVDIAAPTGRVVYIGYSQLPVTYDTKLILTKELDIMGSRGALQSDFEDVVKYLESGAYPADQTISQVFAFSDANKALELWDASPSSVTKFIIDLDR